MKFNLKNPLWKTDPQKAEVNFAKIYKKTYRQDKKKPVDLTSRKKEQEKKKGDEL